MGAGPGGGDARQGGGGGSVKGSTRSETAPTGSDPVKTKAAHEAAASLVTLTAQRALWLEEDRRYLEIRVPRLDTGMARAEDPPSRTCHLIGNLEGGAAAERRGKTAFLVYRSYLETDHQLLSGCREDVLRKVGARGRSRGAQSCSTPTCCSTRTSASSSSCTRFTRGPSGRRCRAGCRNDPGKSVSACRARERDQDQVVEIPYFRLQDQQDNSAAHRQSCTASAVGAGMTLPL
jgi:Ring hydroxylating beta subunit